MTLAETFDAWRDPAGVDLAAEANALEGAAGLARRPNRSWWIARGTDHVDYLHRMLSQDVKGMAVGEARRTCVLDARGRVLADPLAWRLEDGVVLDLDAAALPAAQAQLERYVITEDVVFAEGEVHRLVLAGPGSGEVLAAVGAPAPEVGRHERLAVAGAEGRVLRYDLGALPAFELSFEGAEADVAAAARALAEAGAVPVGAEALDLVRLRAAVPRYGAEIDATILPQEALLEEAAVSWTKGCYPGQEPVAMARYRGRPPHRMMALEAPAPAPAPGTALLREGKAAGRVTSARLDPRDGRVHGLALVRHAWAEAEGDLEVEGLGAAHVRPLPAPSR